MTYEEYLKKARNMTCTCQNNGDYCEACQIYAESTPGKMTAARAHIMLLGSKRYLLNSSFSMTKGFFEALIVIDNAIQQFN